MEATPVARAPRKRKDRDDIEEKAAALEKAAAEMLEAARRRARRTDRDGDDAA